MTADSMPAGEVEDRYGIAGGYLVVAVDSCTCGGGGDWPHEPHCGFEPVATVAEVLAALEGAGITVPSTPYAADTKGEKR